MKSIKSSIPRLPRSVPGLPGRPPPRRRSSATRPKPPTEYHGVITRAEGVDSGERDRAANALIDWLTHGGER